MIVPNARVHFSAGIARGVADALPSMCRTHNTDTIVLSGGVFQNEMLLEDLKAMLGGTQLQIWTNHSVPANDGGISLGQAALAAFGQFNSTAPSASNGAVQL